MQECSKLLKCYLDPRRCLFTMISQVVVAGSGTPVTALISTGNQFTRIDRKFVDERQLPIKPLHGKSHLKGALGHTMQLDGYIADLTVTLGTFTLTVDALVQPGLAMGSIPMILGVDWFARAVHAADYGNRTLRLADGSTHSFGSSTEVPGMAGPILPTTSTATKGAAVVGECAKCSRSSRSALDAVPSERTAPRANATLVQLYGLMHPHLIYDNAGCCAYGSQ